MLVDNAKVESFIFNWFVESFTFQDIIGQISEEYRL